MDLEEIYLFLKENPNAYIPKIYECIQTDTNLIVIEEYLSGKNLEEMLKEKYFSEKDAADIIICLCNALYPLHHAKMPVICRDLKAENVILTNEGEVKLVDFDIARIYQPASQRYCYDGNARLCGTGTVWVRTDGCENRYLCDGCAA